METRSASATYRFAFHGEGGKLFGQFLANWCLTVITLGVYYSWAKANMTQYYYRNTEFAGSRFEFHGTGMEMFVGFLKTLLVLVGIGIVAGLIGVAGGPKAALITFYLILIGLIPIAIVDGLRYTYNRSSWRGVRFSYDGTTGNMAAIYFPGILLTIITLGLYSAWFAAAARREVTANTRFGRNMEFEYAGDGSEMFKTIIKGYLLSIVTLGFYSFWLAADLYNYHYNNTYIHQNNRMAHFRATVTGGALLRMFFVDLLLLIVSLGIATPWIITKNLTYVADNLYIDGDLDLDGIETGEVTYANATGEELVAVMS